MKIFINGQEYATDCQHLADILQQFGYQQNWVASAVNGHIVAASQRQNFLVKEGDHIEVLSPMQGG